MKAGWDVTRNLIVEKTEDVEVPNEIRESCRDDAKEPILGRATELRTSVKL